jgi:hypothetical protein
MKIFAVSKLYKYKWEDSIKMDVKEECEGVDGIDLAQGRA